MLSWNCPSTLKKWGLTGILLDPVKLTEKLLQKIDLIFPPIWANLIRLLVMWWSCWSGWILCHVIVRPTVSKSLFPYPAAFPMWKFHVAPPSVWSEVEWDRLALKSEMQKPVFINFSSCLALPEFSLNLAFAPWSFFLSLERAIIRFYWLAISGQ